MTRQPVLRTFNLLPGELVVDNFAGGGGATTGIEAALGRPVDIAINHSPEAIAMHRANHPETKHFCEDITEVDPRAACGTRPVGLAWFSPDCSHFSRSKGTKPLDNRLRGLAWVVIRWAESVRPRVILLENVEEWAAWGPLDEDNRPIKERAGETFREWLSKLVDLGYRVEFRSLVAADYGSPTTRRRLFLVARRDRAPIAWPEPTHGHGRADPWRAAAEIIDWSLPCRSIFGRERPLKEATLRRIAVGIQRYVLGAERPFIIPVTHHGDTRVHSIAEPLRTVTAAHRGELALVEPFIVRHGHYSTKTGAGLRPIRGGPGAFRGQRLDDPLATVCATNDKHLVCPIVSKHFGGRHPNGKPKAFGQDARQPLGTVTARDHHALTAAFLIKYYGTNTAIGVERPCPTITTGGGRGGGHLAAVQALLRRFCDDDVGAYVTIDGDHYAIVDVGTRMLQPHELFAAQGFPDDYEIAPEFNGKPLTKTAQTELCGNSVCPQVAEALVAENARAA